MRGACYFTSTSHGESRAGAVQRPKLSCVGAVIDGQVPSSDALLVVVTMLDDGGRKAALAFGVALSALANGTRAHVFLSLESARLGTPTGAEGYRPRGFSDSLDDYIRHFLELGSKRRCKPYAPPRNSATRPPSYAAPIAPMRCP